MAASTVFSWGFVIVKGLGLPAPTISFYRLLIGTAVLAAAVRVGGFPRPVSIPTVIGSGICFGLHQLVFIVAAQTTSIAIVTLVGALKPLVVAAISHPLVGERPPRSLKWWALVAVVGVGCVVGANLDHPSRSLLGDLLSVLNVGLTTAFFMFTKKARQQGTHTVTLTAGMLAAAALVVGPALLLVAPKAPSAGWQWALIALLALGPGNGHLLVNWAHPRVSAALASLVLTTVPLLACIWAYLVFDEPYGLPHIVGTILVGIAVEGARRAEEAARAEAPLASPAP